MSTLTTLAFSMQEFPCVDSDTKGGYWTWNVPECLGQWEADLLGRLRAYADGQIVEFSDVAVDPGPTTPFQARVYELCRAIPYGDRMSYGQLARLAGSPGASRAVGQCLARNPIPILIPCHRVVGAGGKLVGFTAPGGLAMKKKLLQLETNALHLKEHSGNIS
ncbi:MAG TPA: MGMT family protein [Thermoguttaceae bacterium]|nr:MGMT family protein [Thermoguttaceae bacterium]